jgi:hypothetical protein
MYGVYNFPVTADAWQSSYGGGNYDAFIAKFDSSGDLVYSTYLGGRYEDRGQILSWTTAAISALPDIRVLRTFRFLQMLAVKLWWRRL